MPTGSPRNGVHVAPTEDQAPVADTTAGHWKFYRIATRPCIVCNDTGVVVYVRVNSYATVSPTDYLLSIADGGWEDISFAGQVNVKRVAIWVPAGGTVANLEINGWEE